MSYFENFQWERLLVDALSTIVIVVGAFLVWLVLSRAMTLMEKGNRMPRSLLLPVRLVLRYAIVIIAVLLLLSAFGIPIGNFWTFVSTLIGLVAIGFVAVWSVLSNISSTFLLLLTQPFRVGDYVKLVGDEVMGEVIDISFMFTTVRSLKGDVFKVPNNQFFQKTTLRPVDPKKLEAESEKDDGTDAKSPDHSMQNLEGVRMPSDTAPARGNR